MRNETILCLQTLLTLGGLNLLKTWKFITLSIIFFFFSVLYCNVSGASMSAQSEHLISLIFQVN